MKFLGTTLPPYDLTYNDVFMVPNLSDIRSRMNVDLTTPDSIGTTIPVIVANMSAVAGKRMAETVARRGGIAILPQDMPEVELKKTISYVKSRHLVFETPITLTPTDRIQNALNLIHKRSHGAVVIVDEKNYPIGIFTERDARHKDRYTLLGDVMSTDLITVEASKNLEDMFAELDKNHVNFAPVVKNSQLVGAVTTKGLVRSKMYQPAIDKNRQLLVGAAIGINGDVASKTQTLLDNKADVIVVDTAHGHQKKMLESLKIVRQIAKKSIIVAGNVVTAQATRDLLEAGADIIKVGVGPGAMCTTRMMTGVGRPQFSAVLECAKVAKEAGKQIWADGGIRYPRDVALALAAGASNVMLGSWLAGTSESVADTQVDHDGRLYKENYGMASKRAVLNRSSKDTPFVIAQKQFFEEGISTSRMYIDPERPGAEDVIDQVVAGVRSSMTYAGAKNINEFHTKAVVGVQSPSGYQEGRAQPTTWD